MPNLRPRRELLAPLALAALLIASPMGASAAFAQSDDAPAATPSPKPSKTPKADKAKEKAAKAQKSPSIDGDKQSELTADDIIDKANAWLDAARTMTADFVQVGPDGERTEGELYLMRPGRLLFRYHPPSQLEIVADGRSVAIRDQKLGTQDLYFIQQTPLKFLVADHIDLRQRSRHQAGRNRRERGDHRSRGQGDVRRQIRDHADLRSADFRAQAMDCHRSAGVPDGGHPVRHRSRLETRSVAVRHRSQRAGEVGADQALRRCGKPAATPWPRGARAPISRPV